MNLQRTLPSQQPLRAAIYHSEDIIKQRQQVRSMAEGLGMRLADQARVVMCVTELVENVVKHTAGGECLLSLIGESQGIRIECRDQGSGILELAAILRERADVSHDLLGAGLVGVRRIADRFEIQSNEHGTTVCVECLHDASQLSEAVR